jgi:hypothetical protein
MKDLIIECVNPEALDKTLNQMGAVVMQNLDGSYCKQDGGYRVRALNGNYEFLKFAIKNQGYGKILKEVSDEEGER